MLRCPQCTAQRPPPETATKCFASSAKERASPGWAGEGDLHQVTWDGGGRLQMLFGSKWVLEKREEFQRKNFTNLVPTAEKTWVCLKTHILLEKALTPE